MIPYYAAVALILLWLLALSLARIFHGFVHLLLIFAVLLLLMGIMIRREKH